MILLLLSPVFCFESKLARALGKKDPEGKIVADVVEDEHKVELIGENAKHGNFYSQKTIDQNSVDEDPDLTKEQKTDIKDEMNSPIIPTPEERLLMKNNYPVVMHYLVRPEQVLLLMKHD